MELVRYIEYYLEYKWSQGSREDIASGSGIEGFMETIIKGLIDKISSYQIFNNLFPGIVFCCLVEETTIFSVSTGTIWKDIFIYYFVGMIISRVGSVFIEKILRTLKIKNKDNKKEFFIQFADYKEYIAASRQDALILKLNETNNMYRSIIAVLVMFIFVKIYEIVLYPRMNLIGRNIMFMIVIFMLIGLFVYSYKKQTDYIRKRVEDYISSKNKK